MQVTIDDKELHEWARANGYVSSDVVDRIRELVAKPQTVEAAQIACLEWQAGASEPTAITREQIADALRSLVHRATPKDMPFDDAQKVGTSVGTELLAKFGAKDVSGVPKDRYAEFMEAAANWTVP